MIRKSLRLMTILFLLTGTVMAQPAEPEATPAPSTTPVPQVQATPLVILATPPVPQTAATPFKPKTVGELWFGPKRDEGSVSESDAAGQQLNFPERKAPKENWATAGDVGESTFVDKLIDVCWSLALIAGLVWITAKLAGKAGLKQIAVGAEPKSMIEILERKRLSPGRTILLMRVGPKVLAVAATENGYETLTEFETEDFKKYQDSVGIESVEKPADTVPDGATTPGDIARHYLSIIPGTGAKK